MPITDIVDQAKKAEELLRASLVRLAEIKPDSLRRKDDLGPFDFGPGLLIFDQVLRLFQMLADSNLDNVPSEVLTALKSQADDALAHFENIQTFDVEATSSPGQARDQLIQAIAQRYNGYYSQIAPVVAYSVRKGTDFEQLEKKAREALHEVEGLKTEMQGTVGGIMTEAKATLDEVRKVAAEAGVKQHAVYFKDEADRHAAARKTWLKVTVILGAMLLVAGVGTVAFYMFNRETLGTGQAIQLGVAKLILFGALYFAVVWASRIYRAESHNFVVNRHRQNALGTFEAFAKAAGDDQTKNAVLLQATQCIFQHQVSGFATQETEGPTSPQVLEIFRGATSVPKQQ